MSAEIIMGVDFKSKRAKAADIFDCIERNELAAKVNAELREKYAEPLPSPGKDSA